MVKGIMNRRGTIRNEKAMMIAGLGPKQVSTPEISKSFSINHFTIIFAIDPQILDNMFSVKTVVSKRAMTTVQYPGTLPTRSEFDAFWEHMETKERSCTQLLEGFLYKVLQIMDGRVKLPPGLAQVFT